MAAQDLSLNDQIKSLNEKNTQLSLALNTSLQENSVIKNELISLKAKQADFDDQIKNSFQSEQKVQQIVKKFSCQVENWKYKFRILEEKVVEFKSIEKQTRTATETLLNENQSIRSIIIHHDCKVKNLLLDNNRLKKELDEKIDQLNNHDEKFLNLKSDLDSLNEELLKTKNLNEKFKLEIENLCTEKCQLENQLYSNHQNLITIKNNCQSNEQSLEERNQMIKILEDEKNNLNTELNSLKISSEYEINELKRQIIKLDLNLKAEIEDKNIFKYQLDEKVEHAYLVELNNKELLENLKKFQEKKKIDNFTQTIFKISNLCLINKSTQTNSHPSQVFSSSFTQTPVIIKRYISTQTQILFYKNISTQTESFRDFNRNLGFKKDWSLSSLNEDFVDSYRENLKPKILTKNENAKSLFDELSRKKIKKVRFSDLDENLKKN